MENNKSNLGMGLSSLLGEANVLNLEQSGNNVVKLDISRIIAAKYQPRKYFHKKHIEELAASIKEKGLLHPVLVKHDAANNKYNLISGERRLRASKSIGLKTINALVVNVSDDDAMEIALIENIQRENLTPVEEAQAIKSLIDLNNYTQEIVASKIGKDRTYVTNLLRLLTLPAKILQLLNEGVITVGHAKTLVNQPDSLNLVQTIVKNNLSVRQTEQLVRDNKEKSNSSIPLQQHNVQKKEYLERLEKEISSNLSMPVRIKHFGKKGRVEVTFKTINEMEFIINKLTR